VGVGQQEAQKTFRPEEEDVTGDWRKLHHEELRCLCSSSGIINVTKIKGDGMGESCGMRSFGEENTSTLRCINRIWNVRKNSVSTSEKTHCINCAQPRKAS